MEFEKEKQLSISEKKQPTKKVVKKQKRRIIIVIVSILILITIITTIYIYLILFSKEDSRIKTDTPIIEKEPEKKLTIVDQNSNDRPLAVMIDNNIGQGLHAGLQESIINYEIIVEGGYTRIMAIFKDKDVSLIGPVRSARHYFLDYAAESDAIYTHFGHSPYVYDDIVELNINNINGMYSSTPFSRDKNIAAPHNVFTTTDKNYEFAKANEFELTSNNWKLLNYKTKTVELNKPIREEKIENPETKELETISIFQEGLTVANNISIPYSYIQTTTYLYNPETKLYYRSMNNKPHIDKITNQQLNYKNIIIQKVSNQTMDKEGRQDLKTTGVGEGFYITNGYAIPITWSKATRTSKTIYKDKQEKEIEINDGNTFIQIIPTSKQPIIN